MSRIHQARERKATTLSNDRRPSRHADRLMAAGNITALPATGAMMLSRLTATERPFPFSAHRLHLHGALWRRFRVGTEKFRLRATETRPGAVSGRNWPMLATFCKAQSNGDTGHPDSHQCHFRDFCPRASLSPFAEPQCQHGTDNTPTSMTSPALGRHRLKQAVCKLRQGQYKRRGNGD